MRNSEILNSVRTDREICKAITKRRVRMIGQREMVSFILEKIMDGKNRERREKQNYKATEYRLYCEMKKLVQSKEKWRVIKN